MTGNSTKNFNRLPGDLQKLSVEIRKTMRDTLPRIVKTEYLNGVSENFQRQGFENDGLEKWQKRKAPAFQKCKNGKPSATYLRFLKKDSSRALLVGDNSQTRGTHLKDTIRGEIQNRKVILSSDKVYAEVHNEGGRAGRSTGFNMPRRQFLGFSKTVNDRIFAKFKRELTRRLNNI